MSEGKKKVWVMPQVIVLVKPTSNENVLATCKAGGGFQTSGFGSDDCGANGCNDYGYS